MLVLGAPKPDKDHQFHALACAVLMNRMVGRLNKIRREKGLYEANLRIGINSGSILAGLIGGANRMQYTVVGDAVNLASRLCGEAGSSQIIIEESMYKKSSRPTRSMLNQASRSRYAAKPSRSPFTT